MDIRELVPPGLLDQLVYDRPETLVEVKCPDEKFDWHHEWKLNFKVRPYVIAVV